jgi:hypothetical protein
MGAVRGIFQTIHRRLPTALGTITLAAAGVLLASDLLKPGLSRGWHDRLGAAPLALIAVAYLIHQSVLRPAPKELFKTVLVAVAFLFWSANLICSDPFGAMVLGDAAIALFVLDVFLVIVGWPQTPPDEGFAETSRDLEGRY